MRRHERHKMPTFFLLCPGRHAGGFIGKEGRSIEALRSKTGASVKIAHFESKVESNSRQRDRLIRVSGSPADIFDCVRLVAMRFQEIAMDSGRYNGRDGGRPGRGSTYQVSVLVPQELMGKIVGAQQKNVRELGAMYGSEVIPGRGPFEFDPLLCKITVRTDILDSLAETVMKLFEQIISSSGGGPGLGGKSDYPSNNPSEFPYPPKVTSNGYITTNVAQQPGTQPPQGRNDGNNNNPGGPPPPPPNYPGGEPFNAAMGGPYNQPPPPPQDGSAPGGPPAAPGYQYPPPYGVPPPGAGQAPAGIPMQEQGPGFGAFQGPMAGVPPPPNYGGAPPYYPGMMGAPSYGKQFAPY